MPRKPAKEQRSEEQIEADERKLLKIKRKGLLIMPSSIKKYTGSIRAPNGTTRLQWQSRFHGENQSLRSRSFRTMEKSIEYVRNMNLEHNLPIKNLIYLYKDQYYCLLTQGQLMKFSKEDFDIVESHLWCSRWNKETKSFYALTLVNDKPASYPQIIFPGMKKGMSGDHKNGDSLDNNRSNLRPVTHRVQALNKRIAKNNTSGFTGVSYIKSCDSWDAHWTSADGQPHMKRFRVDKFGDKAKEAAITYRKQQMALDPDYETALRYRDNV